MNAEPPRPRTVGHRGASALAPENTLRAVQLAIDHGLDLVEVDVHLSRDGEVMVIHDGDLRALARGTERVADRTAAELARVDLGAGQSVPRLVEIFALARRPLRAVVRLNGRGTGAAGGPLAPGGAAPRTGPASRLFLPCLRLPPP